MAKHYELIGSIHGNIYQQKVFAALRFIPFWSNVCKHGRSNSYQWGGWYTVFYWVYCMVERTIGLFSRVPHLSMCRTARVYTACPHPPIPLFLLTWARWVSVSCCHGQCESLFLVVMGKVSLYFLLAWARWVSIFCWHGKGESLFLVDMGKGSLYFLLTWARWVSISCGHGQGESLFLLTCTRGVSIMLLLTWAEYSVSLFSLTWVRGVSVMLLVDMGRAE